MKINLVVEAELKVLDAGSGYDQTPVKTFFPNSTITRLDINKEVKPDIVHDLTKPFPKKYHGQFDVVFCSHILEHIDRLKVIEAMKYLATALKPGGEMWVLVPSLEWAAREILNHRNYTAVQGLLYGSQNDPWQYHKCAFTLPLLRDLMTKHGGLVVRQAFQSEIYLNYNPPIPAMQNIVIGWKPQE
jgi:SAM-dependent methyltransferase